MHRNAPGNFCPLTGHTPEAICLDPFVPCFRVLSAFAAPILIERTTLKSAVLNLFGNPARAIQASLADSTATVEIDHLVTIFGEDLDIHRRASFCFFSHSMTSDSKKRMYLPTLTLGMLPDPVSLHRE